MDIPCDMTTGAVLPLSNQVVEARLETDNDCDWFRIGLSKGQPYAIQADARGIGCTVILRSRLGGNLREGIADTESDGGVELRAPYTGVYYLEASGLDGPCFLRAAKDCADDAQTQCTAKIGRTTGNLQSTTENDWFAIELDRARTYDIRLAIPRGPDESAPTVLTVFSSFGGAIAVGDDIDDAESRVTGFRPPETSTYFLSAGGVYRIEAYTVDVVQR